jgi:hypothetical protein
LEYIDFVVETIGSLEIDKFEMLKKALIGEYLTFSIIREDKVSKEELSEKVCDYFEKMILKSGKNFDKLIESYTKGIDYVVSNKIAKPTQSKKNKSVQEDIPRAGKYYEKALKIKNSRNLSTRNLIDYSRLIFCLYMEILKNHFTVISNFNFVSSELRPDVIINGMKMKEDFRIVKKKYFNIKELYSIDTCTFIIAIIILHTIINERI